MKKGFYATFSKNYLIVCEEQDGPVFENNQCVMPTLFKTEMECLKAAENAIKNENGGTMDDVMIHFVELESF